MNILVNASTSTIGGGVQVADSICRELYRFKQHHFVVVLPEVLSQCKEAIMKYENITIYSYSMQWSSLSLLQKIRKFCFGDNKFLDQIVREKHVDAVLTIFGPAMWRPRVLHLCGFARSQLVLTDSPYYRNIPLIMKIKFSIRRKFKSYAFNKYADVFYTENPYISEKLRHLFEGKNVYTVTNYYNNIFDDSEKWNRNIVLPKFDGLTLLTISENYPHKNLKIIIPTIKLLLNKYPSLKFRFVLTISEDALGNIDATSRQHIIFLGRVSIDQCPFLYEQCDVMFLPTLLECFSASYTEAMKMGRIILTSNLEFAKSICDDAALYVDPLSPENIADAIFQLQSNLKLYNDLTAKGKKRLGFFDNYQERANKLINILETEYSARG